MGREVSIDIARGLAIIFALTSHGLSQFTEQIAALDSALIWVKLITRSATPMFFILFGIMLSRVYLSKARTLEQSRSVAIRIVERAIICYVLYLAITAAAVVSGKFEPIYLLKAMVLLEGGRFGMILAAYAVLFAIIFVTLPVGVRFGAWFYFGIAGVSWATKIALDLAKVGPIAGLQPILGHGTGFGPAILLSFTFVAFGVLVDEAWTGRRSWAMPVAILLIAIFGLAANAFLLGWLENIYSLIFEYRWSNHALYFAYGVVMTAFIIGLTYWASRRQLPKGVYTIGIIGSETLFAYTVGNILLNLLPIYSSSSLLGAAYLVLYLLAIGVLTYKRRVVADFLDRVSLGAVDAIARTYRAGSRGLSEWVVRIFSPVILRTSSS